MTSHEVADAAWGFVEPEPVRWTSGRWALERRGDELADVTCDGVLLARSIRFAARDRDWATVPLSWADAAATDAGLRIDARYEGLGSRWAVSLVVTAREDALDVRLDAVTAEDWDRTRVGLVLLHPPTVAGAALRVGQPDGSQTTTEYPRTIAPHQPARDIRSLAWSADGLDVVAEFGGEVFEMEDHRNWTDASFKTYGTPLGLPVPVHLGAGQHVRQSITLTVDGRGSPPVPATPGPIAFVPSGIPFPQLALAASTEAGAAPAEVSRVPVHLVEVDVDAPGWRLALDRALDAADAAGAAADVRLVAVTPDAIAEPVAALADRRVVRLGVTATRTQVTEPAHWEALVAVAPPGVELVAGARSHFTEVNRRLADLPAAPLAFALTPGAHNVERAQLVESLPMQGLVASTAVGMAAGRPVHVGPVTLRPRYATFAATPPPPPAPGIGYTVDDDATDPRQASPAVAAWTIASAASLASAGVASIAYFETWGPRGVRSAEGPYPVAAAIEALAELAGAERLDVVGTLPEGVWIAAARRDGIDTVLVANLNADEVRVTLPGGTSIVPSFGWLRV